MSSSSLTSKQESYCQYRAIHGLNEIESFLLSYDWNGTNRNVVYVKASELEHSGKISVRIAELKAQVAEAVTKAKIADVIELQELATKEARTADSTRDRLAANRLMGDYHKAFQPQSVTNNVQINVFESLSVDELQRLIAFLQEPGALEAWMEDFKALPGRTIDVEPS